MRIIQGEGGAYKAVRLHAVENDRKLSWKAVGLLLYLVSRPPGWKLFRLDLQKRHSDGRDGVLTGLKELKEGGYLRILEERSTKGQFLPAIWIVAEIPRKTEKEWEKTLRELELIDDEKVMKII